MVSRPTVPAIPSATLEDLNLDREDDRQEWQRRLLDKATKRLAAARSRLERLGVIAADGNLVSSSLPPDMLPDSDTTLEMG